SKPVVPAEFAFKNQGHADRKNVHDGERNQDVPAEMHELVKPVTRQGEPEPHKHVNVSGDFQQEPEGSVKAGHNEFQGGDKERHGKKRSDAETAERASPHEPGLDRYRLLPCPVHAIDSNGGDDQWWENIQPIEPMHV